MMAEDSTMEYVYQLILGQLIFDGYKNSVKALTCELNWTKRKKQISASDKLLQLLAPTKSPGGKSAGKKKPKEIQNNQQDTDTTDDLCMTTDPNNVNKKHTKVREVANEKFAEKKPERITCEFCACKFSRESTYQRHVKKHKQLEKKSEKLDKDIAQTSSVDQSEKESATDEFNLTLEVEGLKQEAIEVCDSKGETVTTEPKEFELNQEQSVDITRDPTRQKESQNKMKSSGKQLDKVCRICNVKFRLLKNLRAHMQEKHSDVKFSPYKCRKCDESFDDAFKRYRHETNEHDGMHPRPAKPVCDFCGVSLSASSLTDHIRAFHTGIKPYKCKYCDRRFVKGSHLKRHHRVHTGEKPYECGVCNKKFADNSGLINHRARGHSVGDENNYKCTVCCKIYKSAADLKRHEMSHMATEDRPHQCTTCGKRFTMLSILKEHGRIHTGIKPYVCQVCGKSFTQNAHLKYHLKIHTEDKPYKCNVCEAGFRCAAARRKHLASHANKKAIEQKPNVESDPSTVRKRKTESKKVIPSKISRKEENSAGLQAAKGLVAMAAGQGTNEKSTQQIIILAPSVGSSDPKQYLLTSGGQLVQQVVMQQPSSQKYITSENVSQQHDGSQVLRSIRNSGKPTTVQEKLTPQGAKSDRSESSENYQLIFVQTSQEPTSSVTDQQSVVPRVLAQTVQSTDGQTVVSSSHGNQTSVLGNQSASPMATHSEVQVTSVGEQVVSQQHVDGQQYQVVMETDQEAGVYQTGDIVSLSMAASNVGQGGESEQLIEEHIVGSEAAVVTSVQWT